MTRLCGFSQTDGKAESSKYWIMSISFQENQMKRAVRGREVKAAAWRRWNVRVHYWGSGRGGAHFIKAGESVGVTWGLVGRGRGEGVWYRVFSGKGGELSRTLRLEQTTPLKWLGRLRSVDVGPLTFKDAHTQTTQHSETDDRVGVKENGLRFILMKHTEQEPAHLGVEVEVWLVFRFWAVMREVHLTECPP